MALRPAPRSFLTSAERRGAPDRRLAAAWTGDDNGEAHVRCHTAFTWRASKSVRPHRSGSGLTDARSSPGVRAQHNGRMLCIRPISCHVIYLSGPSRHGAFSCPRAMPHPSVSAGNCNFDFCVVHAALPGSSASANGSFVSLRLSCGRVGAAP